MDSNERTVELLSSCGEWISIEHSDLKEGDVFRMFEPDGTSVDGSNGWDELKGACFEFKATGDAQCVMDGLWGVTCEPYVKE